MLKTFENKTQTPPADPREVLAAALAKQRRHEEHRRHDGRRCYWCGLADEEVERARAELARLGGEGA